MSQQACPDCGKNVKHRNLCPIVEKKNAVVAAQKRVAEKKKFREEIESLMLTHPKIYDYIQDLECKVSSLKSDLRMEKYGPGSYDGEDSY